MLYATDASLYQVEPIGVVCPKSIRDAEKVVDYCSQHQLPILPRGGGTSLAGQAVNHAVILDFSVFCRQILEIDPEKRFARVEPGVVPDQLNAALAPHRLMFGPDVATNSHANIGGMIGNNSAGMHSILYGRTVEHLNAVDVLLSDGTRLALKQGAAERDSRVADLTRRIAEIIRVNGYNLDLILGQLRRSSRGTFDQVNLAHLVCGSEGTLAVTVEATLNLVETPRSIGLAIIAFADVNAALRSLSAILESRPSAVELIDDVVIRLALENAEYERYVRLLPGGPNGLAGAVLYVEYFAAGQEELRDRCAALKQRFQSHEIVCHTDPAAMGKAWKLRKAGEPLLYGMPGERKPLTFIEDLAVDPQRLADFVEEFREIVSRHGTTAAYYAHASVGCLHMRPMLSLRDERDRHAMHVIVEEATELVKRYGGALSGEHGDGRARSEFLRQFYGAEICSAFEAIKAIFDPGNRLNPGNVAGPKGQTAKLLDNLRVKPDERFVIVPPVKTYFRYQREHGFGEAVEMCNGAGVCRKLKGGTMCPSYRATLDERHATRGRGNALRLAITGQISADGASPAWNDPETLATLDLCLSCKACKTECPSNVDVAKLKSEYLAQSFQASGGVPLRTRMFGNVRRLNRIGSALYPIANAIGRLPPLAALAKRMAGIHPKRNLPRYARSLHRWMNSRVEANPGAPAIILFPDCFTTYNEPHIGRAAVGLLEAFGYRVILPDIGCCGRAQISTGMLADAVKTCRATATALLEHASKESAVAIVGCEPSCVSAIKDEWLDLDLGIDSAALQGLASKSFLTEQFIEAHWNEHPKRPNIMKCRHDRVLLHGHCHQKALWGVESSSALMSRVLGGSGDRLAVLDSGCCGMAGSFGYDRDHYEISMRIGELSLFSAIRESPDAIVVAPGTSCRQQIYDGVGRTAIHPIEFIAELCT